MEGTTYILQHFSGDIFQSNWLYSLNEIINLILFFYHYYRFYTISSSWFSIGVWVTTILHKFPGLF